LRHASRSSRRDDLIWLVSVKVELQQIGWIVGRLPHFRTAGMPGVPVNLWWRHSCATNTLHTRLRVQRAPGIPQGAEDFLQSSGASRREVEKVCHESVISSSEATKQSILPLRGKMDCFAEPVIGRAFARPVGSQCRCGCLKIESGLCAG
jgi:hypothetical protein